MTDKQKKTGRIVRPNNLPKETVLDDTHLKGGFFDSYIEMAENMTPEERREIEEMGFDAFSKKMWGDGNE